MIDSCTAADDRGTTLVELTVALTLMSVFLAMFTAGMVRLYRSAHHNEATATAQSQIHIAFERLDTEIRYAAGISLEGTAAGGSEPYVEYLTTHTGTPVCTQLRLTAGGQLQQRSSDGPTRCTPRWPGSTPRSAASGPPSPPTAGPETVRSCRPAAPRSPVTTVRIRAATR